MQNQKFTTAFDFAEHNSIVGLYRRLGAKGSYLTLVRVADRILYLRGDELWSVLQLHVTIISELHHSVCNQ